MAIELVGTCYTHKYTSVGVSTQSKLITNLGLSYPGKYGLGTRLIHCRLRHFQSKKSNMQKAEPPRYTSSVQDEAITANKLSHALITMSSTAL